MMPIPDQDSISGVPLSMMQSQYHHEVEDDESTLISAELAELEAFENTLEAMQGDEDDASSSSTDFGFVLDIGLLERTNNYYSRHFRSSHLDPASPSYEPSDVLETDSLKLIRQRVSDSEVGEQVKDQVPEVLEVSNKDAKSPHVVTKPIFKKLGSHDVCEVPLGVSLRDILPLYHSQRSSSRPTTTSFSQLVRETNRSESLLDDIDRALEILNVEGL